MPDTVFLHVGAFKTGTTYLQNVLWANRERLAADGVCFPGEKMWREQARAVMEVLNFPGRPEGAAGAWGRLLAEISGWNGPTALVSVERLTFAKPGVIRGIVKDLAPARVRVMLTVRDLARTIAASWQERLKNGASLSWQEFLAAVSDPRLAGQAPARGFWAQQDVVAILDRWARVVGDDAVDVVTVPPAGADRALLLTRFTKALGVNSAGWITEVERANDSLGVVEAELLRRVNPGLRDHLPDQLYERFVKFGVARDVLSRRDNQRRQMLPADEYAWVVPRAEQTVAALRKRGWRVTGDLTDLVPVPPSGVLRETVEASDGEVLDAAVEAIQALVVRLVEQHSSPGSGAARS